jgi:hypothetical protein
MTSWSSFVLTLLRSTLQRSIKIEGVVGKATHEGSTAGGVEFLKLVLLKIVVSVVR